MFPPLVRFKTPASFLWMRRSRAMTLGALGPRARRSDRPARFTAALVCHHNRGEKQIDLASSEGGERGFTDALPSRGGRNGVFWERGQRSGEDNGRTVTSARAESPSAAAATGRTPYFLLRNVKAHTELCDFTHGC